MPYDSIKCNVAGGSLSVDGLLTTWTDIIHVENFQGDVAEQDGLFVLNNFLYDAWLDIDDVPAQGDKHAVYDECYCTSVRGYPSASSIGGKSSKDVDFEVSWAKINRGPNGFIRNRCYFDTYQGSKIKHYDKDGNQTVVTYKNPAIPSLSLSAGRASDIRIPESIHGMRILQYEDFTGVSLPQRMMSQITVSNPFYNAADWNGFKKGELLYIGRKASNDGTPLHLCEYSFLYSDTGWDHFFAVFSLPGGVVPNDIAQINPNSVRPGTGIPNPLPNGLGAWDMLQSVNFNTIFPEGFHIWDLQ